MARPKTRTAKGPDTRKSVKVVDSMHWHLKALAALDGTSIEGVMESYGVPAFAKALERKVGSDAYRKLLTEKTASK